MLCSKSVFVRVVKMTLVFMACGYSFNVVQAAVDPTRPPAMLIEQPTQVYSPLNLNMILSDENGRRAVINEEIVSVSDTINQARVIAIDGEVVILVRQGKRIELRMPISNMTVSIRDE